MQTGVGGVLYPPRALGIPTTLMLLAPTCDDIWFWRGTNIVPVPGRKYKVDG